VLRLFPRYPLRVSLSATGSVREVRILVDGEVAAAADGDASTSSSVQVEAVVPRPADAPAPDTLESRRERVNSAS
jgi:hypothetical protein